MAESTCSQTLYRFCQAIIAVFGEDYLRAQRADDTAWILEKNAARGCPEMLEALTVCIGSLKNKRLDMHGLRALGGREGQP
jgi:hypothetical protein